MWDSLGVRIFKPVISFTHYLFLSFPCLSYPAYIPSLKAWSWSIFTLHSNVCGWSASFDLLKVSPNCYNRGRSKVDIQDSLGQERLIFAKVFGNYWPVIGMNALPALPPSLSPFPLPFPQTVLYTQSKGVLWPARTCDQRQNMQ